MFGKRITMSIVSPE